MKTILKGLLIFIGIIISIIVFLVISFMIWWYYSATQRIKQAEIDRKVFTEQCDTFKYVDEKLEISFLDFKPTEIKTIKFSLIRNHKVIKTAFIKEEDLQHDVFSDNSHFFSTYLPFEKFLKTDTIAITIGEEIFYLTDFHHYAYLHYGMFGYLGTHDCRLSKDYKINNVEKQEFIRKSEGLKMNRKVKK